MFLNERRWRWPRLQDLSILDLNSEFYVNNCTYIYIYIYIWPAGNVWKRKSCFENKETSVFKCLKHIQSPFLLFLTASDGSWGEHTVTRTNTSRNRQNSATTPQKWGTKRDRQSLHTQGIPQDFGRCANLWFVFVFPWVFIGRQTDRQTDRE